MLHTCKKVLLTSKFCLPSVRCYRLPPRFSLCLDQYCQEYNTKKSPTVVQSYEVIKEKIREYEELKEFIGSSDDKELIDIATADLKSISDEIESEVHTIKDELGDYELSDFIV